MKKIIALICTFACVAMLVGCGCNSDQSQKKEETTVNSPSNSISVVPANSTEAQTVKKETVIVTPVPSQKKKKEPKTEKATKAKANAPTQKKSQAKGGKITGSWTFEGGIFVYTFNKDGSGVYTTGSEAMYFNYKTVGNKVIINYKKGGKVTMPYTVKGKVLYLKDENGDDMPYYKNSKK